VLADDADAGQSAEAVIYQGTADQAAPTLRVSLPRSIRAGGAAVTFTVTVRNPSSRPVPDTRVRVSVSSATPGAANVDAGQVHLLYTATGPRTLFAPVRLVGSTSKGNLIRGYVGPLRGATLKPDTADTYTFRVSLAPGAQVAGNGSAVTLSTALDQIDPASGSAATIADTPATVTALPAAKSNSHRTLLIVLGVLLAIIAVIGGVIWRRRRLRPARPVDVSG
jgi:hypothetical protein